MIQKFGSKHNENYFRCLKLISNFNQYIVNNITNFGIKGHGNFSYLESKICDKFISLISKIIVDNIINKMKKSKYKSGIYNGLQEHIRRTSKPVLYVPCTVHSLNLVGKNAIESTCEGMRFLYNTNYV